MAAEDMVALTEVVVPLLCLLQAKIERSQLAEKTVALRDEVIRLEEECQFLQDQVSSTSLLVAFNRTLYIPHGTECITSILRTHTSAFMEITSPLC